MTLEYIEYLHTKGKMPDRYYYQQNGNPFTYNLWEQHQRIYKRARERQKKKQEQEKAFKESIEKELPKALEKELSKQIEKAFL